MQIGMNTARLGNKKSSVFFSLMTGTSNVYSSVLRNVANIATITLSLITTQLTTITRIITLKHQSPPRKRRENIGI